MELIIGGAYQGKLDYATRKYQLTSGDVFFCREEKEMSFDKKCICNFEQFVLRCVKSDVNAREYMEQNRALWADSMIICREIFSGIVPIDDTVRQWREETGRVLTWLASEADEVTRLFCGIPQKIK